MSYHILKDRYAEINNISNTSNIITLLSNLMKHEDKIEKYNLK